MQWLTCLSGGSCFGVEERLLRELHALSCLAAGFRCRQCAAEPPHPRQAHVADRAIQISCCEIIVS